VRVAGKPELIQLDEKGPGAHAMDASWVKDIMSHGCTRMYTDEKHDYFVGLDLGQSQDFTALAVVEHAEFAGPGIR
jgi:hypothetical protein